MFEDYSKIFNEEMIGTQQIQTSYNTWYKSRLFNVYRFNPTST